MTGPAHQKELFTKRFRKVKAPEPHEFQTQITLIQRLGYMAMPDCVYFHIPNGELRDKSAAAKLKAMGTLAGVLDLQFLYQGPTGRLCVLFLELKTRKGTLTDQQSEFMRRVARLGCATETAHSIDEAVAILERYGILTKKLQPRPR